MAEPIIEAELRDAMIGLLALNIADREERLSGQAPRRSELVLADAGLSVGAIAQLTGRKADTVRKAISRDRKGGDEQ